MDIAEKTFGRLGNRLFQCAYIYAQFREGYIPDIYLQDVRYFEKYKQDIRQLFGEGIGQDDRVAIQVRRGDYVNNPFYVDLFATGYYTRAMNEFTGCRFLVSSDDMEFCRERFGHFSFVDFSEKKNTQEALVEMASCNGVIMANSSFGWWAAFLGNPEKVIYPKDWFSDGQQRVGCPKEWISL